MLLAVVLIFCRYNFTSNKCFTQHFILDSELEIVEILLNLLGMGIVSINVNPSNL